MNADLAVPSGADAEAVRASAQAARAALTRQVDTLTADIQRAKADLAEQQKEMQLAFAKRRAELEAAIAPLKTQLEQMSEVLWTADLYLGRRETIRQLRSGTPAPSDTPLTIRQRVLVMAEESLLLMDRGRSGIDYRSIDTWVDWLLADPANLEQILPEPKGVVVLVPTRVASESGNPFEDAAKNAANSEAYWLLRNGERLHLMTTDPDLQLGHRLLPRRREFVEVFDAAMFRRNEPGVRSWIEPGSDAWLRLEAQADARRRHCMRLMLVLQGLVDRTPVFHPLPGGGINLLSVQSQDDGRVVLVSDGDRDLMLGDGRESFRVWQRRLNGLLRPGLRIVGDWSSSDFRDLYRKDESWRSGHPRLRPASAYSVPAPGVPHVIEGRCDAGLFVRYERTDEVWRGSTLTKPTRRASCIITPADTWVLPYDLATTEDLRYYLSSRDNRERYFLSMVPVIRAALAAKEAEAATEAPFRRLIGDMLLAAGADESGVDALVDQLVHDWKVANTWARPLNGEPLHEARAATQILAAYQAQRSAAEDGASERMVAAGRAIPDVVAVARRKDGSWVAYAAAQGAREPGIWLHEIKLRADGSPGATREWIILPPRSVSALTVAWSAPSWADWTFAANPRHYLTATERDALYAELRANAVGTPVVITERFNPSDPTVRTVGVWAWQTTSTPATAQVRPSEDPFDWHWEKKPDLLLPGSIYRVTKSGPAAVTTALIRDGVNFSRFGAEHGLYGGIPWWPQGAPDYGDIRPTLGWSDPDMLAQVADYVSRCRVASKARGAEQKAHEDRAYRHVQPILEGIRAAQVAAARAEFDVDYGQDASDLWPRHLESLRLRDPIHPRRLWGIIATCLRNGEPVVGRSLADVSQAAARYDNRAGGEWHPERGVQDMGAYGDFIVPEPVQEPDFGIIHRGWR